MCYVLRNVSDGKIYKDVGAVALMALLQQAKAAARNALDPFVRKTCLAEMPKLGLIYIRRRAWLKLNQQGQGQAERDG